MSDLQCAARILLAVDGADAATLLAEAAGRRVAAVYRCDGARTRSAGEAVAERLGLPLGTLGDAATSADLRAAVEALADLHRGELLLVLADRAAVTAVLDGMGRPPLAGDRGWAEVLVDADGWAFVEGQQG